MEWDLMNTWYDDEESETRAIKTGFQARKYSVLEQIRRNHPEDDVQYCGRCGKKIRLAKDGYYEGEWELICNGCHDEIIKDKEEMEVVEQ